MIRKLGFLTILLCVCVTMPQAATFTGSDDIKKFLSTSTITIDNTDFPTTELNAFYATQDYRPAWNFANNRGQKDADKFLTSLEALIDWHGLNRDDYPLDTLHKLTSAYDDSNALEREILVTDTLLRFAHDLHGDTINLDLLYPGWTFKRTPLDIPSTLQSALKSQHLNDLVMAAAPKHEAYQKLTLALKHYRDIQAQGGWKEIPTGSILHEGDTSPRIPHVRARLQAEGYADFNDSALKNTTYDSTLAKAVMAFQERNGQLPDGDIGPATLEMMNIPLTTRINQIRANMERWRHMPDEFPPSRYTEVNIVAATIHIHDKDTLLYDGPVVIGKVTRKTPFIQSNIRSMIINPSWHVPKKIAQKDILPKLRKDPHYLEKLGFVISGSEDDPHGDKIDWKSMPTQEFNFHLRQSPGDMNSLGRVKFDFDNNFAVYMHGTPHQDLFDKAKRTQSSGCIRLRDPAEVAEILFASNKKKWTEELISQTIESGKTQWVALENPMPLFVVYWSVFMDEKKQLNFREDSYNYDGILIDAMNEPATLDTATIATPEPSESPP